MRSHCVLSVAVLVTVGCAHHTGVQFIYMANLNSGNVFAYTVNTTSGALTPVAGSPFPAGTYPVSIMVAPVWKTGLRM